MIKEIWISLHERRGGEEAMFLNTKLGLVVFKYHLRISAHSVWSRDISKVDNFEALDLHQFASELNINYIIM